MTAPNSHASNPLELFEDLDPSSFSYDLIIRQQPLRARMCGFGTKDYRPVDPAPILQSIVRDSSGRITRPNLATTPHLVVYASLWSADGQEERGVVLNRGAGARRQEQAGVAPSYTEVLVGSLISPCHIVNDLDGEPAYFFVFSDLSIRTGGQYRFKFNLFDISGDASRAKATAMSDVITVYPPVSFPGMT
ncbi:hypothetical protein HK102_007398, partial [Quaeritorhiza haematococci]